MARFPSWDSTTTRGCSLGQPSMRFPLVKLHLSYSAEKTRIGVLGDVVEVKAFQIIVWVSIAGANSRWLPGTSRLPAILDVGNNHNFAITERYLLTWAGIAAALPELTKIRQQGEKLLLRSAALWLHADDESFELAVHGGIAVHAGTWPRLPILGLRALTNSKLQTFIYGDTRRVHIRRPPPWYWPF